HIMAPKHKWDSVGARSKEQVAELMSRAMAEGRHSSYGSHARISTWSHQGKVIEVTYSRSGGQISNGWVK
ncbi:MAG TPA: polymorphic toxin type 35 domain-containing protein, partial [Pseudonocardia sp.]|nr:polymorphic toxin type 35 domain-containing protein [Pseudonocardia sp.]